MASKIHLKRVILLIYLTLILIEIIINRSSYFEKVSTKDHEIYDIFIISAYYYATSQSLGKNSIALLITTDYSYAVDVGKIRILARNVSHSVEITVPMEEVIPHKVCSWVPLFATGQGLSSLTSLSIHIGNQYHEIPFKLPVYQKHDVVTCISPLFSSDQWQLLTLALHTYKRFGSYVHLYVRSMVEEVFNLVEEYEKEGYLTVDPWPRLHLSTVPEDDFDPNLVVEFRNQAAAQTDCLLKYKESADFISFMDLDDIIFPRIAGTYWDEFRELFQMNSIDTVYDENGNEIEPPNGIGYLYYAKHNIQTETVVDPVQFSLTKMVTSIRFTQREETGKVVVRPEYINHTWIHWPLKVKHGLQRYSIPVGTNVIVHFKSMDPAGTEVLSDKTAPPRFNPIKAVRDTVSPLVSRSAIKSMEMDWQRLNSVESFRSAWRRLPSITFYFNYVKTCFEQIFYKLYYSGQLQKIKCPGPERCQVPIDTGIRCANAKAKYFSSMDGSTVNVHYGRNTRFTIENGCIF